MWRSHRTSINTTTSIPIPPSFTSEFSGMTGFETQEHTFELNFFFVVLEKKEKCVPNHFCYTVLHNLVAKSILNPIINSKKKSGVSQKHKNNTQRSQQNLPQLMSTIVRRRESACIFIFFVWPTFCCLCFKICLFFSFRL